MRSATKTLLLVFAVFAIPSIGVAQNVDILAQNIDIEFENYGSCPLYLVPGTDDYDLCRAQQRQYDWSRKGLRYKSRSRESISTSRTTPNRRQHFNIQERYYQ